VPSTIGGWEDLVSSLTSGGVPSKKAPTLRDFGTSSVIQRKEYSFDIDEYIY
jgi:hypothetical protein